MRVFVTGQHGAGTRSAARYFAEKHGLRYVPEFSFKDTPDKFDRMVRPGDTAIQCPQSAHLCKQLSRHGKVYWTTREHEGLIKTTIATGNPHLAFQMIRNFRMAYPDDPIWQLIEYDGSTDIHYGYPYYFTLFVKIKDYMLQKHLMPYVTVLYAEKMSYWKTPTHREFSLGQEDRHKQALAYWDELFARLA